MKSGPSMLLLRMEPATWAVRRESVLAKVCKHNLNSPGLRIVPNLGLLVLRAEIGRLELVI